MLVDCLSRSSGLSDCGNRTTDVIEGDRARFVVLRDLGMVLLPQVPVLQSFGSSSRLALAEGYAY